MVILVAVGILGMFVLGWVPPLSMIHGYEGSKMYFEGVSSPYVEWRMGDPPPEGASVWNFNRDSINIDPDEHLDGIQNLLGSINTNGQIERSAFGEITDTVSWIVNQDGVRKRVEASIYYFIHDISLHVKVDEGWDGIVWKTEKDSPWRDFQLIFEVYINEFKVEGNLTNESFTAVLGVEIVGWSWARDGGTMTLVTGFQRGQLLAMYDDRELDSVDIDDIEGSDPKPSQFSRRVYVNIPFAEFGISAGIFDSYVVDVLHLRVRVHVLKIDKWILLQKRGEEYGAPTTTESYTNPLDNMLNGIFGVFNLATQTLTTSITILIILVAIAITINMLRIYTPRHRQL